MLKEGILSVTETPADFWPWKYRESTQENDQPARDTE